jgi:hypothetical protein
MQEYQKIVDDTQAILIKNKAEWENRYIGYAEEISRNLLSIKKNRSELNQWEPLYYYLNVTNAKNSKITTRFEVRYLGQTVAELKSNPDKVTLSTKSYDENNLRDFDCGIKLDSVPWLCDDAREFRKHFKDRPPMRNRADNNKGNEEHRLESLLLTEFSKPSGKLLPNIKPITVENFRFPMPTPISASQKGDAKYAKQRGGGIDIFARVGTGGQATYLCVIELKDEPEPASNVLKQAIKYAAFIRELLRSEAGEVWWKLLGFNGVIPNKLLIHAVCAMPNDDKAETDFAKQQPLKIGTDEIQLDYIYFTESSNKIINISHSLPYGKK